MNNFTNINIEMIISDTTLDIKKTLEAKKINTFINFNEDSIAKGIRFTLLFLREAMLLNNADIFSQNVNWFLSTTKFHDVPSFLYYESLNNLKSTLVKYLDTKSFEQATNIMSEALENKCHQLLLSESYFDQFGTKKSYCVEYLNFILEFDDENAKKVIFDAYSSSNTILDLYKSILIPVQYEIGRLWQLGRISVSQEHYCTTTTRNIIAILMNNESNIISRPKTFLGTCVDEEHHSMGIKIVSDYFKLSGWKTILLEGNTPVDTIISTVKEQNVDIIGISATMPYTFNAITQYIETIKSVEFKNSPFILVGGLAFNDYPDTWKKVKADGYTKSAEEAVLLAEKLLQN